MSKPLPIEHHSQLPKGFVALAEKRTNDLIMYYGRNITDRRMTIQALAMSCWIQGVEDAHRASQPDIFTDYQI